MRITPKQKKVLEFIYNSTIENGYAPSQREIANHFDWKSLGTVQDYLKKLMAKGLLKKEWNARRAIEVEESFFDTHMKPRQATSIAIFGRIAAGEPIEAITESRSSICVPNEILGDGEFFALTVQGSSMVEDGIINGDKIIIRKQDTANNGETVVALVDGDATVKKFYRKPKKIELRPANKKMKSILMDAKRVKVQGVVVGLFRKY